MKKMIIDRLNLTVRARLGVKIALMVNFCLLIVMTIGTSMLVIHEKNRVEHELLAKGKQQALIGAEIIGTILDEAVNNGVFSIDDVFDTNYEKIDNFSPPKYHTKYDGYLDKTVLKIQDRFLKDESILYAIGSDRNGYVPTHNSRYQQPFSGDFKKDKLSNRSKRVFNDSIGLKAAQNKMPTLMQTYNRDTGEKVWDISSPILVKGRHWGGFRVGMSIETIALAQKEISKKLLGIMLSILFVSVLFAYFIVNCSLASVKSLSDTANSLAKGQALQNEIAITENNEIGELQKALERLRLSMLIALKRKRNIIS